ncbi:hypothetical protein P879_00013 [Paragonimus westermani]|uniref:Uncharacterized protein n=1 Tax=Paragonimus westermani TaxID=34504 RepID=A0A8T0DX29_9TREM|nr:hypothetical protein P879_00013 [Paragonimus westermani]
MRPIPVYVLPSQMQPTSKQYQANAQPFLSPLPNQRPKISYNDQTVPVLNNLLNQGFPVSNGCAFNVNLNMTTLLAQNPYPSGFFYRTLPNKNQCGSMNLFSEQRRLLLSGITNTIVPNHDQTNLPQWTTDYPEENGRKPLLTGDNLLKRRELYPSQSQSDISERLSHIEKSVDESTSKDFVYLQSANPDANNDDENDTKKVNNSRVKSPVVQDCEEHKVNPDCNGCSPVVEELHLTTSTDRRSQNLGSSFADSGVDVQGPINVELLDMCVSCDRNEKRKSHQPGVDGEKPSAASITSDRLNDKRRRTSCKSTKTTNIHQQETVPREKSNSNVSRQNGRTTTKVYSDVPNKTGHLHGDRKRNANFPQKMPPRSGVMRANKTRYVTDYPEDVKTKLLDHAVITTD